MYEFVAVGVGCCYAAAHTSVDVEAGPVDARVRLDGLDVAVQVVQTQIVEQLGRNLKLEYALGAAVLARRHVLVRIAQLAVLCAPQRLAATLVSNHLVVASAANR